jgi:LuxR family transcriptional regulator, maltose regulon positive regulatory protein
MAVEEPVDARMPFGFTLLESKLRLPIERPGTVARTSLVDRLRAGRRAPIVVIEAPAGYGKTTLVADWLRGDRRRSGCYSIDEQDNDPVLFLTYLAAALNRAGASADPAVERLSSRGAAVASVVNELRRALASLAAPAVLVLDDVHVLQDRTCLGALADLLDQVPARSQIVLLTRTPLEFASSPLHTAGRVLRLGTDELRMSDSEAHALVRGAGLALSPEDVRMLNARCEGWATGLFLIALAGRNAFDRLREEANVGVDRFIGDYLHLEVLDRLEADDREFLVQAAVLDRICGPLCDAMLGRFDSRAKLWSLAESNLFVYPLDDEGDWFRLHPLLRDLLRAELARSDASRGTALLARAVDWYEACGDMEAAVECAILAEDRHRIAGLVAAAALPASWSGRWVMLERWFAALDDTRLLAEHPDVAVLGAGLMAIAGRPQMAERWAHAAFQGDPHATMPDGSPAAAWVDVLKALLCAEGIQAMRDDAERAVATLAGGSRLASVARLLLSFADLLGGDDERAAESLAATIEIARSLGANVGAATAMATVSLLAAERGDLGEAAELAYRARDVMGDGHLDEDVTSAAVHTAAARVAVAHGNWAVARAAVERADRTVRGLTYALPWLAVFVRLELAHLHLALDEPARARELLEEIHDISVQRPDLGVLNDRIAQLRHDLDSGRSGHDGWVSAFTPAELRLLPLLASHLSFREISGRLEISRNTVKTQAIAVYRKLDVSSRSEAVARARELGLVRADIT